VEPLFEDVPHEIHRSSLQHGIKDICKELTSKKEEINLVICGGDGSMFDAVNGVADFEKTRIGMIPCGSGNDLAKDLQMPKKIEELVSIIKKGEIHRTMDLGEVIFHTRYAYMDHENHKVHPFYSNADYSQYFNVSSGIGFDAKTCQQVFLSKAKPFLNKIHLGKLVYLFVAIRLIFENEMFLCTFENLDRKEKHSKCLFAVGMNHRFEGGGFMFGPGAKDNDGLLESCLIKNITPFTFLRLFPSAYKGKHVRYKDKVIIEEGNSIHIESDKPMWVHTDGEVYYASDSITLKVHPNWLKLLF